MKAILNLKGCALLAAIDAGLLPKIDGGWDDQAFEQFWRNFMDNLRKADEKLNNQDDHSCDDSRHYWKEEFVNCILMLIGSLIGSAIGGFIVHSFI